jgi:predicted GNAT superfamily acetyltransferase
MTSLARAAFLRCPRVRKGSTISSTGSRTSNANEDGVSIRPLESSEDFQAFEDLQREVWGQQLSEVVTTSLAQIVQKIGGIAAGAFDERGAMVGAVFGFTGFSNGRPVHWSHMLAVKSNVRDTGIGRKLKLHQRDVLLRSGIEEVFWTYDPLVSRNAHLNFNSLGVEVSEYVTDMYGTGEDSELFRGIGTDRFIVVWRIGSRRVESFLARERQGDVTAFQETPLSVSRVDESDPCSPPRTSKLIQVPSLRIEIPPDVHLVRDRSPSVAAEWRRVTREAFQRYLSAGYEIGMFYRDVQSGRCYYCLKTTD